MLAIDVSDERRAQKQGKRNFVKLIISTAANLFVDARVTAIVSASLHRLFHSSVGPRGTFLRVIVQFRGSQGRIAIPASAKQRATDVVVFTAVGN